MKRAEVGSGRARHYPLPHPRASIGPHVGEARLRRVLPHPGRLLAVVLVVPLIAGALLGCPAADRPATGPAASSATASPAISSSAADSAATDASTTAAAEIASAGSEGASARTGGDSSSSKMDRRPAIVFLGTSLTAGFGLPESEAYPALIETRLAAAGLDYRVVNAGVSGDTSAGGLRRLDWLLRLPIAVLVVELGANDMLRGQPVEALEANLVAILDKTRAAHPEARFVIEGMRAAPNLGREYGAAFDSVYPRVAERFHAAFVPFLLEDVVARSGLNQADGIHPTAEGHALIAERVWRTLEPVVREVGARTAR